MVQHVAQNIGSIFCDVMRSCQRSEVRPTSSEHNTDMVIRYTITKVKFTLKFECSDLNKLSGFNTLPGLEESHIFIVQIRGEDFISYLRIWTIIKKIYAEWYFEIFAGLSFWSKLTVMSYPRAVIVRKCINKSSKSSIINFQTILSAARKISICLLKYIYLLQTIFLS